MPSNMNVEPGLTAIEIVHTDREPYVLGETSLVRTGLFSTPEASHTLLAAVRIMMFGRSAASEDARSCNNPYSITTLEGTR
jgi:hypothetical protein